MKYMLLIHDDEKAWAKMTDAERQRIYGEYGQFGQQIKDGGQYLAGAQLQPVSTATSVRVRDGKRLVTDGPFAETREQLGGFYVIEAGSLDEALDWAAKIPGALTGSVEVRPIMDYEAMRAPAAQGAESAS